MVHLYGWCRPPGRLLLHSDSILCETSAVLVFIFAHCAGSSFPSRRWNEMPSFLGLFPHDEVRGSLLCPPRITVVADSRLYPRSPLHYLFTSVSIQFTGFGRQRRASRQFLLPMVRPCLSSNVATFFSVFAEALLGVKVCGR